jgi:cytochrome c
MRIRAAGAPIVQAIITLWVVAILAGGAQAQTMQIWTVPEVGALPYDANGLLVRRGRDLITATYAYIGPNVPDVAQRYAGNNLACSNCHTSQRACGSSRSRCLVYTESFRNIARALRPKLPSKTASIPA